MTTKLPAKFSSDESILGLAKPNLAKKANRFFLTRLTGEHIRKRAPANAEAQLEQKNVASDV